MSYETLKRILPLLALIGAFSAANGSPANASELIFIVNADNPVREVSTQEISDMFFKKKREWPDGSSVRFIDHRDDTMERKAFLKHFLGRSERNIELYWIGQKLYSGNAAPIQVLTDENAELMVASFKGGISYVSSAHQMGKGVKKVPVVGSTAQ